MDLCWQSDVSAFQYAIQVGHSFSYKECLVISFIPDPIGIWFMVPENQFPCGRFLLLVYVGVVVFQFLSHVRLFATHGLQHTRLPCPSPSPSVCSNSCPLSPWCHPTISSSVVPFSSCSPSFLASGSFPMSRLFVPGGQSIGTSALASILPMNIQHWFPLGLTGLISLVNTRDSQESSSAPQFKSINSSVLSLFYDLTLII